MGDRVVRGTYRWSSLDRIEPRHGYVRGNIGVLCYRCNNLKRDGMLDEFEAISAYMRRALDKKM
jgi:hypothetical protein